MIMSNEMIEKCTCCGEKTINGKCTYCGNIRIENIDGSANSIIEENANKHRYRVVKKIKNISVKTYKYGWNAANTDIEQQSAEYLKLCDGEDCLGRIYYCPERFAQNPGISEEERTMYISYEVDGNEKNVDVAIKPVKCAEYWDLGVKISDDLKLEVYIGDSENRAERKEIKLNLI